MEDNELEAVEVRKDLGLTGEEAAAAVVDVDGFEEIVVREVFDSMLLKGFIGS